MEWTNRQDNLFRRLWHTCRDSDAASEIGKSEKSCKARARRLRDDPAFAAAMREREHDYREMLNGDKSIRFIASGYRPPGNLYQQQRRRLAADVGRGPDMAARDHCGGVR